jgi:6-methylsalicylic acid synthase
MVNGNPATQPPDDAAEPIAVVGLGCRFAGGADSPDAFWDLLIQGRDGIGPVPDGRWEPYQGLGADYAAAVRNATRFGGFVADIEKFDAEFFGLTPREAELMDPQQRILLEVAWEALEHAGIPPRGLAGSDAGVFVGIGSDDYGRRLLENLPHIEAWTGIGAAMCAAANRISYVLDLRGPSLAVDTACSASLVAVHLACQSLRAAESTVALAAGVNLIVSPGLTLTLDAAGATAPDGRSKSFDASADGYGRGEGCGVLVLKRLSDARRDGDRILSVIRGSAVNQDGRTNGIMAPSGPAQEHVLDRACRQARVAPSSIGYVEAHGTGTRLGDPLEAGALSAIYGAGREPEQPCLIGSVKSNIGHLEAGAGVAGMIKAVLALHRGEIPPTLHHTVGNPAVDWAASGLRVVTERTPWPGSDAPRRAGVSAFGYGGTVAHVVMEESPDGEAASPAEDDAADRLYPLSAASTAALREQAGRMADWLSTDDGRVPVASVAHTLAMRRSHLDHRAAVVAAGRDDLATKLRRLADEEPAQEVVTGSVPAEPPTGLVWVFSGHGSQWVGMGRDLLATEPRFAEVIDELEPIFAAEIGFSPRQVLIDGDLEAVDRIQTMIFAMQVGLARVWQEYGVRPDAVIGHSVGEIAAAVTAGAFTLADGARLICRRSRLLRRVAGNGAMAMVTLPFDEVAERLSGRDDLVAAIASSPVSTVVSGDQAAIETLLVEWAADGIAVRRVASDVAFHSPHMDPLLAELTAAAADLSPTRPRIPMYTTALDDPRSLTTVDGAYWASNLRNPVRLAAAVGAAVHDGHRAFLEISAHPVVAHSIGETLADTDDTFVGSSLRRNLPERTTLLGNLGTLYCNGLPMDWARVQPDGGLVTLPGTAWQRGSHWRDGLPTDAGGGLTHDLDAHALLGAPVSVAGQPLRLWRTLLDEPSRPYPGSHTINGVEIVPAAVLINTFLAAGTNGAGRPALTDIALKLPVTVAERREVQVQRDEDAVRLATRALAEEAGEDRAWLTHSTARTSPASAVELPASLPAAGDLDRTDPGEVLRHLASVGVPTMGFEWTVEELWRGDGRLRAHVEVEQPVDAPDTWAPVLDAALSVAPFAYPGPPTLRMVAGVDEVRVTGEPPNRAHIAVTVDAGGAGDPAGDGTDTAVEVLIADPDGQVVARLSGLRYAVMDRDPVSIADPRQLVHEVAWRPIDLPAGDGADRRAVLVTPDPAAADGLRARLAAAGLDCAVVADPDELTGAVTDVLVLPAPAGGSPVASPAGGDAVAEAAAGGAWLLARTAQRLAAAGSGAPAPRLWCLSTGVRESRAEAHLAQAPLWGLSRVIAGEHAELGATVVDLDPDDPASADAIPALLRAAPREDVVALRGGTASVARLARPEGDRVRGPLRCRADGTYLVTGGLGVLGMEVARWLADRGARRIVLAGRRALPPRGEWDRATAEETRRQIAGVRALEALGVTVVPVAVDIADAEQAARSLDADSLGLPPYRGVVHAAGVLDNRMLAGLDEESLRHVMRPKVAGAWSLHQLFPPGTLDFLALFSSCGYLLGLPGQASYGSANAFLDALAAHRRAGGHDDTISFGWTSWRGQGMAVNAVVDLELAARGVTDISTTEAFDAWDLAHGHGGGHFPVLRTVRLEPGMDRLPLLAEVAAGEEEAGAPAPGDGSDAFAGLTPEELRERLLAEVGSQIAAEMRLTAKDLDPRRSLAEQGLDSVMTIVVRRRLEKRFGQALPATLLWHQPTVSAIAEHLAALLAGGPPEAGEAQSTGPAAEPQPMVGV